MAEGVGGVEGSFPGCLAFPHPHVADPRFEPTSGKLNPHMFKQSFGFVDHEAVRASKEEGALVAWRKQERDKVSKVGASYPQATIVIAVQGTLTCVSLLGEVVCEAVP